MAAQSELINTNAGPFAIRDFGRRGPDLLFVHGTGHNLEVWSPLAQALRGCFRMVAFDMRGHGQTPVIAGSAQQTHDRRCTSRTKTREKHVTKRSAARP